jgi:hypothetical protein
MNKIIKVYFILQWICCSVYGQKEFTSDSFYVQEGKESYKGAKDLSVKLKVYSTGNKIVLEADVIDDKLVTHNDPALSDRIELWLSLPLSKKDTIFNSINAVTPQPPLYYFHVDTTDKNKPIYSFYSIAAGGLANIDTSVKVDNYYGQVHYAFFPDNRRSVRLDKEKYEYLEKVIGEKLGHVEQGVQYKWESSKSGYKVTISLSPLALGFVTIPEMNSLNMMIDVFDVDEDKTISHISSSSIRFPGQVCTYSKIDFNKSFKTNVTTIPTELFDSLNFHPTVMFNEKGFWSGVSMDRACIQKENCSIIQSVYLRSSFGYKKRKIGKQEVEELIKAEQKIYSPDKGKNFIIGGTEENYIVAKKRFTSYRRSNWEEWNFKGLKKEFTFPDQSVGLLLFLHEGGYGEDSCSAVVSKVLRIVKVNEKEAKELFKLTQDDCNHITYIGNFKINGLLIEKIYWVKEGAVLMIEARIPAVGIKKYKLVFQGEKVIVSEIKK